MQLNFGTCIPAQHECRSRLIDGARPAIRQSQGPGASRDARRCS